MSSTHGNGTIRRFANFPSKYISPRHIDIWCPPGYAKRRNQRYPVLYMHDGQNLFDPVLAYGNVDWGIDEAITHLMNTKGFPGAIVVGIWNSEIRWREYMPQKIFEALQPHELNVYTERTEGPAISDKYLQFLVKELKPAIDSNFRTLPNQPNTFIMGSSMGGLISLYAISEYPKVFHGAGCLSTHWVAGGTHLVDLMATNLPDPKRHKLYFDFGTETLDEAYEPYQRRMDAHLREAGYAENQNWITLKFEGAEHSERSWRERVNIPLEFLFGL
jgi:predicted alpha/beta superfamily hydrolase